MFSFDSIEQYHAALCSGTTSCAAAVHHYLEMINRNSRLNAFVEVYEDEALKRAAELDNERQSGEPLKKLHGVVIANKDVICYAGHRVSAASKMLNGFTSVYTATALQLLLDEGAIIIGSCNCDEFAMGSTNENSVYGPVLNAADETKVPGGSSGGSAVAVQAGLCMLSLGSDTGGSVRQPADFCGIVGLKPGYGTVSRYGLIAYASSFDQIGIFGKNIADVRLLLDVMGQPDLMDSTMNPAATLPKTDIPKRLRVAFLRQAINHKAVDAEIAEKITALRIELVEAGHEAEEIDFDLIDYIVPAYYVLTTAEAGSNLSRYDGIRFGHRSSEAPADLDSFYTNNRTEGFGAEVKRRIMLGAFVLSTGYYDAYYSKAQKIRRMLTDRTEAIFADYDAIIMPVSPVTAFTLGAHDRDPVSMYLADIFTVFANLTGLPAIALPLFSHSNNMPFGIQVLCNRGSELTLLRISETLMQMKKLA